MSRPTGRGQADAAKAAAGFGGLAFVVALFFGDTVWRLSLIALAGLSLQIAFLLAIASSIIRAISFLPGRQPDEPNGIAPSSSPRVGTAVSEVRSAGESIPDTSLDKFVVGAMVLIAVMIGAMFLYTSVGK